MHGVYKGIILPILLLDKIILNELFKNVVETTHFICLRVTDINHENRSTHTN